MTTPRIGYYNTWYNRIAWYEWSDPNWQVESITTVDLGFGKAPENPNTVTCYREIGNTWEMNTYPSSECPVGWTEVYGGPDTESDPYIADLPGFEFVFILISSIIIVIWYNENNNKK